MWHNVVNKCVKPRVRIKIKGKISGKQNGGEEKTTYKWCYFNKSENKTEFVLLSKIKMKSYILFGW